MKILKAVLNKTENELITLINKIEGKDAEQADKLKGAIKQVLSQIVEGV